MSDFYQYPFLARALIALLLLALMSGLLSPMVLVRRYAFLGESISHSTLLSITLTQALLGGMQLTAPFIFLCTLFCTLILTSFLAFSTQKEETPSDTLIGIYLVTTLALALVVHHFSPYRQQDLSSLLFGNIFLLQNWEIYALALATFLTFALLLLRFRAWIYFLFDRQGAKLSGISTQRYHLLLFFLLTLFIVLGAKVCGTILINSFLLIPGLLGIKRGAGPMAPFLFSTLHALSSSLVGLFIANQWDLPLSAAIALTQLAFLALALLFFRRPS